MNLEQISAITYVDFFLQAFSTLLGALLAFIFGLLLYKKQKHSEDKAYLDYTIAVLCSLISHLYNFKEQFAERRKNECADIRKELDDAAKAARIPRIAMKETAQYMYGTEFKTSFDIQRLSFLIKRDPNMILLIGALIDATQALNQLCNDINCEIQKYCQEETRPSDNQALLMIQKNEILYTQTDRVLYLSEKTHGLLIAFGKLEYGRRMKIESFGLTDDKYQKIKPQPIASWEKNYKWFPKKKLFKFS